ncbi:MAG: biopolymer transporter ExbD [Gammaproteobacteria bacterium]|nr:biopolymer transporter ExbD [Gammaproteobacteria bacterium]
MKFQRHQEDELELNIAPLIDVVFLLLIFFMVSTTFQKERALAIQLPQANSSDVQQSEMLELLITATGDYYIGDKQVKRDQRQRLTQAIIAAISAAPATSHQVVIRADQQTPHQAVITAMDAIRHAGLSQIGFATLQSE